MSQNNLRYGALSYNELYEKHKDSLAKELSEIYDFLKEANNLEELYVRSALIKVPAYMNVRIGGEYYYFKDDEWYIDDMPF
jgi:Asp-tRNA(Asn)/Glu-tRNA(Gln) amidotransferase C subunit